MSITQEKKSSIQRRKNSRIINQEANISVQANNRIRYIEDYLPVKDIRNGVIETTDKRYVKILEVEPINFLLRSEREKQVIVDLFAAWLKSAPKRLQFKSLTRKADSQKHINGLYEDLKFETNERCRNMTKNYIDLIREIGGKEAVTRRFFIAYAFEQPKTRRVSSYNDIINSMEQTAHTIRSYFSRIGNNIIIPDNAEVHLADILYTYFNRRSCITESFDERFERVLLDTYKEQNKQYGIDNIDSLNINTIIGPRGIDLTHNNYLIIDGLYYNYFYIRSDGYPTEVSAAWLNELITAGDGIDVDIYLNREDRAKTMNAVGRNLRFNKIKIKDKGDTASDYEDLESSIQSGYYIKRSLANNESLFWMNVLITISAKSLEELYYKREYITDLLLSKDIRIMECYNKKESAFMSSMPLVTIDKGLYKKSKRNILTKGAASTYVFSSFELCDDNGILIGVNTHNRSLVILDLFDTKKYKNANMVILGTTGSGKTFTEQLMALRMRMRHIQVFFICPLKGHEYKLACQNIGGSYIVLAPGSKNCVNIMEIRPNMNDSEAILDEDENRNFNTSLLSNKIQQLKIFFQLKLRDEIISIEEDQLLDEALIKTYAAKGITNDNTSVWKDAERGIVKEMPIIGDLYNVLMEDNRTHRLATAIKDFVNGSSSNMNGQTNVDLSNEYIIFNVSEAGKNLLPVYTFIALDYVWDEVKKDRSKRKAVFMDELWQLLINEMSAEFVFEIFKIIRGYGGAAIAATQDMNDFFSFQNGKYGKGIINNAKTKIVLNLENEEAEYVREVMNLSDTEISNIVSFQRGEGLICTNNTKVSVYVRASDEEERLITTDRAIISKNIEEKKRRMQMEKEMQLSQ